MPHQVVRRPKKEAANKPAAAGLKMGWWSKRTKVLIRPVASPRKNIGSGWVVESERRMRIRRVIRRLAI